MKPKNVIEQYKKFLKETPQLSFEMEDKYMAVFHLDEDVLATDITLVNQTIDFLKVDADAIPELAYLLNFMQEYTKALENKQTEFKIEVDLNKLKFCKILLSYIEEEYTNFILSNLDFLQDQLVDEFHLEASRVFFFSDNGFCVVRKDILSKGLEVPLAEGDTYYGKKYPLEYRWRDEDFFEVLYAGQWVVAYCIDFEFPFEHLRAK